MHFFQKLRMKGHLAFSFGSHLSMISTRNIKEDLLMNVISATTLRKAGLIFLAMNLVGIAVALFLAAGLGSDSIGLLCDGISCFLNISFGNASLLYNLAIILSAFLLARQNIGGGTIVYALMSGYFIDFYGLLLSPIHLGSQHFLLRILAFCMGQFCLSLALALLISMRLGMNALDALLCKAENRSRIPYAWMRTAVDISYVVMGTLMGGTFGPGTICSVLLTGFMVGKFTKVLS